MSQSSSEAVARPRIGIGGPKDRVPDLPRLSGDNTPVILGSMTFALPGEIDVVCDTAARGRTAWSAGEHIGARTSSCRALWKYG